MLSGNGFGGRVQEASVQMPSFGRGTDSALGAAMDLRVDHCHRKPQQAERPPRGPSLAFCRDARNAPKWAPSPNEAAADFTWGRWSSTSAWSLTIFRP